MLKRIVYIALIIVSATACSEYQKVLKSTDLNLKYTKAVEYYNEEKYNKAYPLFDELLGLYRGTQKAADVYYYFAYTNYHLGDYILAAYHFKNFSKTFPTHEKAEECAFMVGYCYYLESPAYSLDQTYTYKAINELQLFVNTHQDSERLLQCNDLIIELRRKLEKKSFEIAELYYKTGYYQSAVVAFNNTLNDYPDTKYREEAYYLRLKSAYELAKNSIESKKLQRFIESKTAYFDFIERYPEGANVEDAVQMYVEIQDQIENLKKIQS
ncbi:MAG: outer membrane protein assembly factor BamD [Owenweeksia sp.]|nr:outer membrane protein assembly factor BamD [Owenweeksia sp.]MBF98861.1 outer membrane protein assembly factor BamD [Owenweeksia sp.]HBF22164.1 outer membrane protein assembly factor BamD [Cryomorphaceae bacterium]HCQ16670.1 outer membrane protein assembly factor BamD [Cryomorphaceae bacterium]|tara:strand:+ start:4275 stop:5081 length:807 start_codon:yes stop_codon:yes gene_type:complete